MRDKLIELIKYGLLCPNMNTPFGYACDTCQYAEAPECDHARLADYLIANGVTFADVPDNNVGDKWIPISERLPEPFVSVLVQMPEERPCPTVHEGFLTNNGTWYAGYFERESSEVAHWMPMPKSHSEEEQNNG
jgi:hypothetical protein